MEDWFAVMEDRFAVIQARCPPTPHHQANQGHQDMSLLEGLQVAQAESRQPHAKAQLEAGS